MQEKGTPKPYLCQVNNRVRNLDLVQIRELRRFLIAAISIRNGRFWFVLGWPRAGRVVPLDRRLAPAATVGMT